MKKRFIDFTLGTGIQDKKDAKLTEEFKATFDKILPRLNSNELEAGPCSDGELIFKGTIICPTVKECKSTLVLVKADIKNTLTECKKVTERLIMSGSKLF